MPLHHAEVPALPTLTITEHGQTVEVFLYYRHKDDNVQAEAINQYESTWNLRLPSLQSDGCIDRCQDDDLCCAPLEVCQHGAAN